MLVIVSDLHLADNTLGKTTSEGAFEILRDSLRDMALSASTRGGGKYVPIEKITLVLLGDIIDIVRTTRWQEAHVRPWDFVAKSAENGLLFEFVESITDSILDENRVAAARVKALSDTKETNLAKRVAIPATADPNSPQIVVPVEIFYMVGNHDWFFAIPDKGLNPVREKIREAFGLHHGGGPFPYVPEDLSELDNILREHGVCARHGDHLDPINRYGERDRLGSSLGDALVIDLMARFIHETRSVNPALHKSLREIDNVRPLESLPFWLHGTLKRHATAEEEKWLRNRWNEIVDEFFRIPFVKTCDTLNPVQPIDWMQVGFKLGTASDRSITGGLARRIMPVLDKLEMLQPDAYAIGALAELPIQSGERKYVVYGHTHNPKIVPLKIVEDGGTRTEQIYFNSGTWRNCWVQTLVAPEQGNTIPFHMITILAFYKDDEREGRHFEIWNGNLEL